MGKYYKAWLGGPRLFALIVVDEIIFDVYFMQTSKYYKAWLGGPRLFPLIVVDEIIFDVYFMQTSCHTTHIDLTPALFYLVHCGCVH